MKHGGMGRCSLGGRRVLGGAEGPPRLSWRLNPGDATHVPQEGQLQPPTGHSCDRLPLPRHTSPGPEQPPTWEKAHRPPRVTTCSLACLPGGQQCLQTYGGFHDFALKIISSGLKVPGDIRKASSFRLTGRWGPEQMFFWKRIKKNNEVEKRWSAIRSFALVPLTWGRYGRRAFPCATLYLVKPQRAGKAGRILRVSLCSPESNTKQNFQCQGCGGRERGRSWEGNGAVLRKLLGSQVRGPPRRGPPQARPLLSSPVAGTGGGSIRGRSSVSRFSRTI